MNWPNAYAGLRAGGADVPRVHATRHAGGDGGEGGPLGATAARLAPLTSGWGGTAGTGDVAWKSRGPRIRP
jgi:hypothetical protein